MQHYLTTAEVAAHYRTAPGTVRYWRHIGYGPKGAKVGRRFLYPAAAIAKFDDELLAQAVSEGTAPEVQSGASATGNDEAAGVQPAASVEQVHAPTH
ncbi:helix-turn-helix domain-containing protein [Streptomyces sp. NPDC090073]|uniref:helix-turn-helix domain-containing protein n=1 Tax=Streptomyces sp. NPDC090073 TaxID=3365936 RepID=UPI00381DC252